jgi:hypothetical protein
MEGRADPVTLFIPPAFPLPEERLYEAFPPGLAVLLFDLGFEFPPVFPELAEGRL